MKNRNVQRRKGRRSWRIGKKRIARYAPDGGLFPRRVLFAGSAFGSAGGLRCGCLVNGVGQVLFEIIIAEALGAESDFAVTSDHQNGRERGNGQQAIQPVREIHVNFWLLDGEKRRDQRLVVIAICAEKYHGRIAAKREP